MKPNEAQTYSTIVYGQTTINMIFFWNEVMVFHIQSLEKDI